MAKFYAGLDVSQDKTSICVVDDASKRHLKPNPR